MNREEFIKLANKLRKENKNDWVVLREEVEGKIVELKSYGLWIQVLRIDGVNHNGGFCSTVKQYNECLGKI